MIRHFDPERDSFEEVARLNDWEPNMQAWWAASLRQRCINVNLLVMEEEGQLIGLLMLLDGGLPILMVEGAYIKPEYRTFARGRELLHAIDAEARRRGVTLVFSHTPDRIGKGMTYYGYQRINDISYGLYGRVVPQES